jgi:hypothetical protein
MKLRYIPITALCVFIGTPALAQPNVFVMVDIVQQGGPSAIQSSTAYSREKGASYSDTSVSAASSKSRSASSQSAKSGASYKSSAAAAASNGYSSAAARASASGARASSYKSSSASSASAASVSKSNVAYENHDNVSFGQTSYARTAGDAGLAASEALSLFSGSLLQTQVDVTYPEMILAPYFNEPQLPSFARVRRDPRYSKILAAMVEQNVGFILGATLTVRGTGGMVSKYGCSGTLSASLSSTSAKPISANFAASGSATGVNLEDCQRNLATELSDRLAGQIRPKLGD